MGYIAGAMSGGDLGGGYHYKVGANGKLQLWQGEVMINEQDEYGAWTKTSITTGTGSLHIGDLHSNGSGGENVVWVNTDSNVAYYPSWAGVSVDGSSTFPMSARTHGALASAEPAGIASIYTNCDYNTTFTATADVAFFYVDIVAGEDYTGVAKWTATKSTGKEVAAFYFDCVATKGDTLRIQFKYPLWVKNGQVFTVTLQKEDGSYLQARSSQQGLEIPYRKTWFRPFTDHNVSTVAFGDTKNSYAAADHNGWILMNGRTKSSLNAAQQARATALGFGPNIPNGRDRFVVGAGSSYALGIMGGSKTLTAANLPNVRIGMDFTSQDNNATHTHKIDPPTIRTGNGSPHKHGIDLSTVTGTGNHEHNYEKMGVRNASGTDFGVGNGSYTTASTFNTGAHTHQVKGDSAQESAHDHEVNFSEFDSKAETQKHQHRILGETNSINGNVPQTNFLPEYIALNIFIYLGE